MFGALTFFSFFWNGLAKLGRGARGESEIACFTLPWRAGQSHMGIERRTKRNRLWNKSTRKGCDSQFVHAHAIPLPWRGRVAHRRCAGWGARRRRDSQRAARAFTPTRRASRRDRPPPGGGGWEDARGG